jgi:hypothetical protein
LLFLSNRGFRFPAEIGYRISTKIAFISYGMPIIAYKSFLGMEEGGIIII